jgi:hypothetical protein
MNLDLIGPGRSPPAGKSSSVAEWIGAEEAGNLVLRAIVRTEKHLEKSATQ